MNCGNWDLNLSANSDDFIFDNQMLCQIFYQGYEIGEISCPAKYFDEASSINFRRSSTYGLGVLKTSLIYRLNKWGLLSTDIFKKPVKKRVEVIDTQN